MAIHHHKRFDSECWPSVIEILFEITASNQVQDFKKIQRYVLATILVLVLQLGFLMKPFAYRFFRLVAWASYLLVPVLISYILGLMGQSGYLSKDDPSNHNAILMPNPFLYLSCVWVIFLLFAYTGFDNLNAFSLEERNGRSKIVLQVGIQFTLLVLILRELPLTTMVIPIACIFLILCFKFLGRLLALAHSAGATPRIKTDLSRIIDFMNVDQPHDLDPMTMKGYNYLVGPKYSRLEALEKKRIADGVTLEKIWGCQRRLLLSTNMELKDTCLSFSLFWLLLGKFSGFPLYNEDCNSRAKAWKLVRHGLLADKNERVFRVIEVELAFLRDYFHARYIFFYLNGFYWKLLSILALPVMFWWFIQYSTDNIHRFDDGKTYGGYTFTKIANTIVISVILALEAIQLLVFLNSRWLKVTMVCLYVKRMTPELQEKPPGRLSSWLLEIVGSVFLGSSRSSNSAKWRKPWKRELDQYSLIQSRTSLPKATRFLHLHVVSILGIPLPKPNIKKGRAIGLSEQVKQAVVTSLKRNSNRPKLSNGVASLKRNEVMEEFSWACKLESEIKVILVWHIATSFCEIHPQSSSTASSNDMKVATTLSKYCAYLLFFASSLLPFPALDAESICNTVAEEAIELFKKPALLACGNTISNSDNYEKMTRLIIDMEIESDPKSINVLKKGAKLGNELVTLVSDQEKRWKILAEFWAEMLLFLAPSNNNEMAHADRLSEGGEFITHLWALLIHAGITNRDDMTTAFQQDGDDEDVSRQPGGDSA